MGITVKQIQQSFELFYENALDEEFCKTMMLSHWSERDLLLCIRTFLLGWYGQVSPEYGSKKGSDWGRLDFLIGNVAIEVAVQAENSVGSKLTAQQNKTECWKLMQHKGPGALVLLDFSKVRSLSPAQLDAYREPPSLGRGAWARSNYSVLYYFRSGDSCQCQRLNVQAAGNRVPAPELSE
jgi:hypothetical protein